MAWRWGKSEPDRVGCIIDLTGRWIKAINVSVQRYTPFIKLSMVNECPLKWANTTMRSWKALITPRGIGEKKLSIDDLTGDQ
jgi:hypothetical protein